jgi:hypothetical protein
VLSSCVFLAPGKRAPGLRIWGRSTVPDRAGGWRSGTANKLEIRVLIGESKCSNLDSGGGAPHKEKPAGSSLGHRRRGHDSGWRVHHGDVHVGAIIEFTMKRPREPATTS